jgi:hypothetical protein
MKPSTKVNFLMLTGSAFMMIGVFAKPLGIPSDFDSIPPLVAVVFIYLGYRASKKAKAAGQIPASSDSGERKRFALMVASCALACIAAPFVLPSTGVTLPFWELVVISVAAFLLCIGAIWLGMKMRK